MTITVNDLGTMPNGEVVKQVVIENANGHKLGLVSWEPHGNSCKLRLVMN